MHKDRSRDDHKVDPYSLSWWMSKYLRQQAVHIYPQTPELLMSVSETCTVCASNGWAPRGFSSSSAELFFVGCLLSISMVRVVRSDHECLQIVSETTTAFENSRVSPREAIS